MISVEMARFAKKHDVTEEDLIAASKKMQNDFMAKRPGFISRHLLHIRGDEYMDLVHWKDAAAAENAMQAASASPVVGAYFGLMDMENFDAAVNMVHGNVLATYPS